MAFCEHCENGENLGGVAQIYPEFIKLQIRTLLLYSTSDHSDAGFYAEISDMVSESMPEPEN
jgi:hypothetical protein